MRFSKFFEGKDSPYSEFTEISLSFFCPLEDFPRRDRLLEPFGYQSPGSADCPSNQRFPVSPHMGSFSFLFLVGGFSMNFVMGMRIEDRAI